MDLCRVITQPHLPNAPKPEPLQCKLFLIRRLWITILNFIYVSSGYFSKSVHVPYYGNGKS